MIKHYLFNLKHILFHLLNLFFNNNYLIELNPLLNLKHFNLLFQKFQNR
jgi:hypothetical protein